MEPAEGETVPVTLTVPKGQIDEDAAFLVVYHMVERKDGSYYAEPVQYAPRGKGDQKIRFGTTAFSIYAVAAVGKKAGDAGSVEIRTDGTPERSITRSRKNRARCSFSRTTMRQITRIIGTPGP